ncbi:MAG: B12-binding domain-containing radical SAM protein [Flavobacteriales bacterium]|nr:B12-binding domain-containing radical SAM protein [Flavobacteriales bacterium]
MFEANDKNEATTVLERDAQVSPLTAPTKETEKAEEKQPYGARPGGRTLSVCLINPRFEPSYWGFDYALPLYPGDRKSTMINGGLPTVAGLGGDHNFRIIDENVEEIDWAMMSSYDIVGLTGMIVRKDRMKEILLKLRDIDTHVIVGGPLLFVQEDFFDGLCDTKFIGEVEETWPGFLEDFASNRPIQLRYEQEEKTDMSRMPSPRFDLLKVDRYASGALQFSRGCPFQCEFCDIIVIFGRRPRLKDPEQVIKELDEMRKNGFFLAMLVDDNFIGNMKKAKALLHHIIAWQKKHDYPLRLNTEASVNLADDPELLELMYEANFRSVFIGIETPNEESLKETKKIQNIRGDSLEAKLGRIQKAGLDISAGFIVGFDNDKSDIFDIQYNFIQNNGILLAMVGMLAAIPKTPLFERLEKEGRLVLDDPNLNFNPKQMSRDELKKNYWELVRKLYTPEAFLERYLMTYQYPDFHQRRAEISDKAHEGRFMPTLGFSIILFWNLFWTLVRDGSLRSVGRVYFRFYWQHRKYRKGVVGAAMFINRCVTHWHFYKFTREVQAGRLRAYNSG